jgi:hypothetical protein
VARCAPPGVFCIEGGWSRHLADRSSVRPLLELLENQGCVTFIHRDAGTPGEFEFYLNKWVQRGYDRYALAYFAFHGDPGGLWIGRYWYTLEKLAELLRGRCAGLVLYFGSCSTLDIDDDELAWFRRVTKARAVCGYNADVDWLESAAFELLLIQAVTRYKRINAGFEWLERSYGDLVDRLELRYVW